MACLFHACKQFPLRLTITKLRSSLLFLFLLIYFCYDLSNEISLEEIFLRNFADYPSVLSIFFIRKLVVEILFKLKENRYPQFLNSLSKIFTVKILQYIQYILLRLKIY